MSDSPRKARKKFIVYTCGRLVAVVKPVTISFPAQYRESRDVGHAGHRIGKLCTFCGNRRPRDTQRVSN